MVEVTATITIKIGEAEHELNLADAQKLRDELAALLGPPRPPRKKCK